MMRPRKPIGTAAHRAKLDEVQMAVRREAEGTEADPFDDAMLAAVIGVAEAMEMEAVALADLETQLGKLARA